LPVLIQPGETYLFKKTMSLVLIEEVVVPNVQFRVRKEEGQIIKVGLEDLLCDVGRAQDATNESFADLDLSQFGLLLSVSSQMMREENGDPWFYDKEFIANNIVRANGKVLTSLIEFYHGRKRSGDVPVQLILLAHKPLRTKKYLLALAYGIPIVNLDWLRESFKYKKLLDWEAFRMPNGESLIWNRLAVSHPNQNGIFNSKLIYSI
jgi:hypothetical protein